jgi:hypothetical protein
MFHVGVISLLYVPLLDDGSQLFMFSLSFSGMHQDPSLTISHPTIRPQSDET